MYHGLCYDKRLGADKIPRAARTMLTNVTFILQTLTRTLPTRSSTQSILALSLILAKPMLSQLLHLDGRLTLMIKNDHSPTW
jgi:hypothetical protein